MPLPSFLTGSYKRYKSDTEQFATWLAETAAKHCDPSLLPNRKNDKTPNKSHKLSAKDFTTFSELIANHSPRIEVPQVIAGAARRAISLRRRFARHLSRDKGHSHFIGVLERALQVLHVPDDVVSTSSVPSSSSSTEEAANRFSVLDLEEPLEDERGGKRTKIEATSEERTKYELEDDFDGKDDVLMLICFCLLNDLNNIRDFLKQTWADYQAGKVDLMSASVTTDTALVLAKQAIEQAEKTKNFPKEDGQFQMAIFMAMCLGAGEDPQFGSNGTFSKFASHNLSQSYLSRDISVVIYPRTPDFIDKSMNP